MSTTSSQAPAMMTNSVHKTGVLLVYAEPGHRVTDDEFHDWYDGEHIPLRLPHIPAFLSGVRYISHDSATKPRFAALYSIADNRIYSHPSYANLRANRSAREADVVRRLERLDRRIYELIGDSEPAGADRDRPRAKDEASGLFVAASLTLPAGGEEKVEEWVWGARAKEMRGVEGWKRTRTFRLLEPVVTGLGTSDGDAVKVPKYMVLDEYADASFYTSASSLSPLRAAPGADGATETEERIMKLFRAFEPEAAQKVWAEGKEITRV